MTGQHIALGSARALLFVPGHRPDRFDKAVAAGADAVILDLEDAVAPEDKDTARADVGRWLKDGGRAVVRINAPGSAWFDADLELVAGLRVPVMVPKAQDAEVLERISGLVPEIIALVETALGVERAAELCAVPGVTRLAFGSVDLATELGIQHDDALALAYARSRLVMASAATGAAAPIDGVTTDLHDVEVLAEDVRHARRLGFTAKLCVHPKQIPWVRSGFTPTDAELDWARRVLTAGSGVGVSTVDGKMVDKPVLERARRLALCDPARLASAEAQAAPRGVVVGPGTTEVPDPPPPGDAST